jgi:hypothetical protein
MENESHSAYTIRMRNLMERARIKADARVRAMQRKNNTFNNQEYKQEASGIKAEMPEENGFPNTGIVFEA